MRKILVLMLLTGLALAAGGPVGEPVPNFTLTNPFSGEGRSLQQLAPGKPLVLVVWCSTCPSCRAVEGEIDRLARDYAGRAVVVALDANQPESTEDIRAALRHKSLSFPVWLDRQGKVVGHYKIGATTSTLVIDSQGRLRYLGRFGGAEEGWLGRKALEQMLAGDEVSPSSTPLRGCRVMRP